MSKENIVSLTIRVKIMNLLKTNNYRGLLYFVLEKEDGLPTWVTNKTAKIAIDINGLEDKDNQKAIDKMKKEMFNLTSGYETSIMITEIDDKKKKELKKEGYNEYKVLMDYIIDNTKYRVINYPSLKEYGSLKGFKKDFLYYYERTLKRENSVVGYNTSLEFTLKERMRLLFKNKCDALVVIKEYGDEFSDEKFKELFSISSYLFEPSAIPFVTYYDYKALGITTEELFSSEFNLYSNETLITICLSENIKYYGKESVYYELAYFLLLRLVEENKLNKDFLYLRAITKDEVDFFQTIGVEIEYRGRYLKTTVEELRRVLDKFLTKDGE